jgi:hypothetical protein
MTPVEHHLASEPGGEDWREMPEFPTAAEIMKPTSTSCSPVLPNRVYQPWDDKRQYLEVQWRLLRCEGVEGLRFSVNDYINQTNAKQIRHRQESQLIADDGFTCIYTEVINDGPAPK